VVLRCRKWMVRKCAETKMIVGTMVVVLVYVLTWSTITHVHVPADITRTHGMVRKLVCLWSAHLSHQVSRMEYSSVQKARVELLPFQKQ